MVILYGFSVMVLIVLVLSFLLVFGFICCALRFRFGGGCIF